MGHEPKREESIDGGLVCIIIAVCVLLLVGAGVLGWCINEKQHNSIHTHKWDKWSEVKTEKWKRWNCREWTFYDRFFQERYCKDCNEWEKKEVSIQELVKE